MGNKPKPKEEFIDRKKQDKIQKILSKYPTMEKILDQQLAQIDRANDRISMIEQTMTRNDNHKKKMLEDTIAYKDEAVVLYERVLRRKKAIEYCIAEELTATEEEIFIERYVKGNVWKAVLSGYETRFKYLNDKRLCTKMYHSISKVEREYRREHESENGTE